MQRTGLAILALLIVLLISAGVDSPGRAQAAQSDVAQATKGPDNKPRLMLPTEVRKPSPKGVPDFSRLTHNEASALARKNGLEPEFYGATGNDARVAGQSLKVGTPMLRTGTPVRLRMEAQELPPPSPAPTPAPAPQPAPQPAPAPTPPPPPPPPCVSRDLISWLIAAPKQAVSPTCQGYETRNWLILLVIAAGLVGGALAFFLWPPDPDPPKPVPPKPVPPKPIARLVTQTISTGLAGIIVSIKAADARRFEIRYVMERDARPMSDATRITNSVDGGDDGR